MQAKFKGEVELSDLDPPNGYTISGKGSGGVAGNARGAAKVRLEPAGAGTKLIYDVDAQVTGKLAQLGSRLIDSTAKMLAGQFFTKFGDIVGKSAAPVAARATAAGTSSTATSAPSGVVWASESSKGVPAWFWAVMISLFIVLFSFYFKR